MTDPKPNRLAEDRTPPPLRALLREDLGALLVAAAVTLGLELGAYALARGAGTASRGALLVALAAATMWVALASAPLAAGGRGGFSAALRGAVPADASLVALVVLWPLARGADAAPYLTLASIAKTYAVLAAMALCSVAAIACGRGRTARQGLAVAAALVLAAAITTPFWAGGLVHALPYEPATTAVAWAVRANPFYSVTGAVSERARFFWHEWGLMYERIGTFRDYAPPPVLWYSAPALCAALAAVLGLAAILRGLLRKKPRLVL